MKINKKSALIESFMKAEKAKKDKKAPLLVETESVKNFGNLGRWCCCGGCGSIH